MPDISNRSQNSLCEHGQSRLKIQADLLHVMVGMKDKTGLFLSSVGESQPHLMGIGGRVVHRGVNKPFGVVKRVGPGVFRIPILLV